MSSRKFFKAVDTLTDAEQGIGGLAYLNSASDEMLAQIHNQSNEMAQSILNFVSGWAIIHGIFSVVNGIGLWLDKEDLNQVSTDPQTAALNARIRKAKAGLHVMSGLCLAGGGYEALGTANNISTDATAKLFRSSSVGLPLLHLTFAITAGIDFFSALHNYQQVYKAEIEQSSASQNMNIRNEAAFKIESAKFNALAKGITWLGWSFLALGGVCPALGLMFLAGGPIIFSVVKHHASSRALFFSTQHASESGSTGANTATNNARRSP